MKGAHIVAVIAVPVAAAGDGECGDSDTVTDDDRADAKGDSDINGGGSGGNHFSPSVGKGEGTRMVVLMGRLQCRDAFTGAEDK